MTEPVYILGGYQTDFAKNWSRDGQDISDIVRETATGALANCRLEASDIETIHVAAFLPALDNFLVYQIIERVPSSHNYTLNEYEVKVVFALLTR